MVRWWFRQKIQTIYLTAALLIAVVALCDWRLTFNATLGFLYLFPLAMLGTVLRVWQIVVVASICVELSALLDPFSMDMQVPRGILVFLTLATVGLLSRQIAIGYRSEMESLARLKEEAEARRGELAARLAAEEQLDFLIQNSPAAIFTMTPAGEILLANPAAHFLLNVPEGSLSGGSIKRYIPELGAVPSVDATATAYRTQMQTRGQRSNGEVFVADVYFSTYRTPSGPRLAALIVDASEVLREREEAGLEQLLTGSRILVAAVSHEIRNVCAAVGVVYENLSRSGLVTGNQDFESLGSLIATLGQIASLELKRSTGKASSTTFDVQEVLTDLRIVLEPSCVESDIQLRWDCPDVLPAVQADRQLLMQILLNLTKNSQRALEDSEEKWIQVSAKYGAGRVSIQVADSGPGISPGRHLFQPLQEGAKATGLGLYLSRAFARSFNGDLHHIPTERGCLFSLDLIAPPERLAKADAIVTHP